MAGSTGRNRPGIKNMINLAKAILPNVLDLVLRTWEQYYHPYYLFFFISSKMANTILMHQRIFNILGLGH